MTSNIVLPRITRSYINKMKNDKISSNNDKKSSNVTFNVSYDTRVVIKHKYKYNIISRIIYDVYNIMLPEINYVEDKIIIKTLMNTVFNNNNSNKQEEINYNKLKDLIGNVIEFPPYGLYKEYDNELTRLIKVNFCLSNYIDYYSEYNNRSDDKYTIKKSILYGVLCGILFNILLFGYLFYFEIINFKDINNIMDEIDTYIKPISFDYASCYNIITTPPPLLMMREWIPTIQNIKSIISQYIILPIIKNVNIFIDSVNL